MSNKNIVDDKTLRAVFSRGGTQIQEWLGSLGADKSVWNECPRANWLLYALVKSGKVAVPTLLRAGAACCRWAFEHMQKSKKKVSAKFSEPCLDAFAVAENGVTGESDLKKVAQATHAAADASAEAVIDGYPEAAMLCDAAAKLLASAESLILDGNTSEDGAKYLAASVKLAYDAVESSLKKVPTVAATERLWRDMTMIVRKTVVNGLPS
jgi:hypothetical protein